MRNRYASLGEEVQGLQSPDLKKLQGTWQVVSLEVDGAAVGAAALTGASISVNGERFVSLGMGARFEGSVELNPAAKPKQIALRFDEGPKKGIVNHGIYEVGKGGWKLCLATRGGPAPESFSTVAGSGHAFEVLKRGEAPATVIEFPGPHEAVKELQGKWAMVSCLLNGTPLPSSFAVSGVRIVEGVETSLSFGAEAYMTGLLSASGEPGQMVLHHKSGGLAGKSQLGIYELQGDRLTTCVGPAGGLRPTSFHATQADRNTLSVWQRLLE